MILPRSVFAQFGASMVVFVYAVVRAFGAAGHPGLTVIAILISAALWLAASFAAEWESPSRNALNAVAAAFAALAGIAAFDHGAARVVDFIAGRAAPSPCFCATGP